MMTSDKPRRRVSQAPIKITDCFAGCGTLVEYRTNPRVYCDPCRAEKIRAAARDSMEKQRRKRGVVKVKGSKINCEGCGVEVVLNRRAETRFCRPCYLDNNASEAPARAAKKARYRSRSRLSCGMAT